MMLRPVSIGYDKMARILLSGSMMKTERIVCSLAEHSVISSFVGCSSRSSLESISVQNCRLHLRNN
jgi:hypothetical protein